MGENNLTLESVWRLHWHIGLIDTDLNFSFLYNNRSVTDLNTYYKPLHLLQLSCRWIFTVCEDCYPLLQYDQPEDNPCSLEDHYAYMPICNLAHGQHGYKF